MPENIIATLADQLCGIGLQGLVQSTHDSVWEEGVIRPGADFRSERFTTDLATNLLLWPIELQGPRCMQIMLSKGSGLRFKMADLRSSFLADRDIEGLSARVGSFPSQLKHATLLWSLYGRRIPPHRWHTPLPGGFSPAELLRRLLSERFLFWLECMSLFRQMDVARHQLEAILDWDCQMSLQRNHEKQVIDLAT